MVLDHGLHFIQVYIIHDNEYGFGGTCFVKKIFVIEKVYSKRNEVNNV